MQKRKVNALCQAMRGLDLRQDMAPLKGMEPLRYE